MKDEILHALSEEIQEQDYCIVLITQSLPAGRIRTRRQKIWRWVRLWGHGFRFRALRKR